MDINYIQFKNSGDNVDMLVAYLPYREALLKVRRLTDIKSVRQLGINYVTIMTHKKAS